MASGTSNSYCEICDLKFTSVMFLMEHQKSSDHKLRTLLKDPNTLSRRPISKPNDMFECQDGDVYKCLVCDIFVTGIIPFKQHLAGSKHEKKVRNKQAMGTFKNMMLVSDMISGLRDLSLNDTEYKTSSDFEVKRDELEFSKCNDRDFTHSITNVTLLDGSVNNLLFKADTLAFPYTCEPCGKRFTGKEPYQQHIESVLHLKKVRLTTTGVQQLDTFVCRDCSCNFSGPIPYTQHLDSPKHAKQIMANTILQRVVREGNSNSASASNVSLFEQEDETTLWKKLERANLDSMTPSLPDDINRISADEPIRLN